MRRLVLGFALSAAFLLTALAPPSAGAGISGARAKDLVREIAALGARPAGSVRERRAGSKVRAKLEEYGFTTEIQRFRLPNGDFSRNVVGRTQGRIRVVILAHVDGVRGTVAANDNASGVATMVEIARALGGGTDGVLVAALGAEERHVTGSRHHLGSRRLLRSLSAAERTGIRLALSLDMVGVGSLLHVRGLEASPNRSARKTLRAARERGYRVTYLQDSGQSDHAEFTRGGVPAAWVQWRWDVCWHSPCDRPARVDPRKLKTAGRLAARAARNTLG